MKGKHVNLHMNKKRALCFVAFFSMIALSIYIFLGITLERDNSQLSSLLKSNYEYSIMTRNPVGQDDYCLFDAEISFTTSVNASSCINADIVMQIFETHYTSAVVWNAGKLNQDEVAISGSVARNYGLKKGDEIYSKHVVNGTVIGYKVAQILPEVATARMEKTKNYSKGIIILGNDDTYLKNLSHKYIIYTNVPIQELESNTSEGILYREDEILIVIKRLAPYIIVFSVVIIILVCVLTVIITKNIEHNFKRLSILGFEQKTLNKSYMLLIGGIVISALLFSCVISLMVYKIMKLCIFGIWISIMLTVIGVVSLIMSMYIFRQQLWRK